MGKELELLQKMELTAENRQKLETLITEAKKTGKVSSKHLVETLDDVDATQAQTEQEKAWYQTIFDQSVASSLLQRQGTLEEQAAPILFLASRDAGYITGTRLPVAGGDLG